MTDYDWPTDRTERLRALWDEGLSASEIGRRLGVSKNAVLGKVHRLHLPGRPSPIRNPRPAGAPRRQASAPRPVPPAPPTPPPAPAAPREMRQPPAPDDEPKRAPAPVRVLRNPPACQWPVWTDQRQRPRHLFCGAPSAPGWQPYCTEHSARSTVRGSILTAEALAA